MDSNSNNESIIKDKLDKIKKFCMVHLMTNSKDDIPQIPLSMFLQWDIASYCLSGELPNNKIPEWWNELYMKISLLKVLTESKTLRITGYKNNSTTGKIEIPSSIIRDHIKQLDNEIWGEEGSFSRQVMESEFPTLENLIEDITPFIRKRKMSKSSFLGFYCKGWLDELCLHRVFDTNYQRMCFIFDLLHEYGIPLIQEEFQYEPNNKDKETYIKGLMTIYRKLSVNLKERWNCQNSSEWVNFL